VFARYSPPLAIPDRVATMDKLGLMVLDHPGDLLIATPIDCGNRRERYTIDVGLFPDVNANGLVFPLDRISCSIAPGQNTVPESPTTRPSVTGSSDRGCLCVTSA